jgi:hypothetical protein
LDSERDEEQAIEVGANEGGSGSEQSFGVGMWCSGHSTMPKAEQHHNDAPSLAQPHPISEGKDQINEDADD